MGVLDHGLRHLLFGGHGDEDDGAVLPHDRLLDSHHAGAAAPARAHGAHGLRLLLLLLLCSGGGRGEGRGGGRRGGDADALLAVDGHSLDQLDDGRLRDHGAGAGAAAGALDDEPRRRALGSGRLLAHDRRHQRLLLLLQLAMLLLLLLTLLLLKLLGPLLLLLLLLLLGGANLTPEDRALRAVLHAPEVTPALIGRTRNLGEGGVQRQVVTDGVLPALHVHPEEVQENSDEVKAKKKKHPPL